MRKKVVFYILSLVIGCSISHANLLMKITADNDVLILGGSDEESKTTVRVWGLAEEAVGTNGLYDWGLSAVVDVTGIVQANSALILEPDPVDTSGPGSTLNIGATGNVDASAAIQWDAGESDAGVGVYAELFNFEIEAIGLGDVQYSLKNVIGDLYDWDTSQFTIAYDDPNPTVNPESVGLISVVPEPATILILSGFGVMGLLHRKRS